MQGVYKQEGAAWVHVSPTYLSYVGRIARYKRYASCGELELLTEFMECLKQLPQEQARLLLLRYFKLARYEPSRDKAIINKTHLLVWEKFKGRCAKIGEVAEAMNVTTATAKKLERESYDLLATLLLARKIEKTT